MWASPRTQWALKSESSALHRLRTRLDRQLLQQSRAKRIFGHRQNTLETFVDCVFQWLIGVFCKTVLCERTALIGSEVTIDTRVDWRIRVSLDTMMVEMSANLGSVVAERAFKRSIVVEVLEEIMAVETLLAGCRVRAFTAFVERSTICIMKYHSEIVKTKLTMEA